MEERGLFVYRFSINRWSIRFQLMLEKVFFQHNNYMLWQEKSVHFESE
jgi:hypothetical protein